MFQGQFLGGAWFLAGGLRHLADEVRDVQAETQASPEIKEQHRKVTVLQDTGL